MIPLSQSAASSGSLRTPALITIEYVDLLIHFVLTNIYSTPHFSPTCYASCALMSSPDLPPTPIATLVVTTVESYPVLAGLGCSIILGCRGPCGCVYWPSRVWVLWCCGCEATPGPRPFTACYYWWYSCFTWITSRCVGHTLF